MRFQAKTQDQIDAENLLKPGTYPFTVKVASEKQDRNGKGFFKLKVFVHGPDGRDWHCFDNLSPEWFAHKLLHFCEGTGLGEKYLSGNLSSDDLMERTGHCEVDIKDSQGGYPAKNIITDYVVREKHGQMLPSKTASPLPREQDDDTPF